ncbi:hypothetical protein SOM46_12000 [Pseudomonas fluorescens]|uniref:hypothetical protein n=1 Tax=Pseudomonas fluorescens TaxID=294 RepID=UPI00177EAD39|nr:hypothetical protein [Pseudomonas fluorescens]MBD8238972.1 hypothetical protein [Pseudomonas fluorescens]MDY0895668.1 hypothetical protein [Pseudomonas fluorescens]
MALSVSSAYLPPASTSLAPSDQKLVPQPLTDVAKDALANAAPAAIYHPSEDTSTTAKPLEVVDTWVGRSESPEYPRYAELFRAAHSTLKASFQAFQATLSTTAPDLASKKYGFTVDADGSLKVLNTAGQLNSSDTQRLTDLLNKSLGLKTAAVTYRDAAIDMTDASSPWSGSAMGYYSLTQENFANTIDLAPLFKDKHSMVPAEFRDAEFVTQLAYKGERATEATEAAMLARRAAQRFSTQA